MDRASLQVVETADYMRRRAEALAAANRPTRDPAASANMGGPPSRLDEQQAQVRIATTATSGICGTNTMPLLNGCRRTWQTWACDQVNRMDTAHSKITQLVNGAVRTAWVLYDILARWAEGVLILCGRY